MPGLIKTRIVFTAYIDALVHNSFSICDEDGAKYNFPKFHELLHIVNDTLRFGASTNLCAQRPEALLKSAAKKLGRRAQKQHKGTKYELQAAQRLAYSFMIDTVHSRIWNNATDEASPTPPDTDKLFESTGQASFSTMTRTPLPTQPTSYYHNYDWDIQTNVGLMAVPIELLRFLGNEFGNHVWFCTIDKRDIYTLCCHPCYQSDGPIFDWMLVRFEGYDEEFPCRLAAVVINDAVDILDAKQYKLVVQSTTK